MKLYRDFTTQEEIDRQYNMATMVADMPAMLESFSRRSAEVRRNLRCKLDVRFGPTLEETVDIFPAEHPGAPVLVFIHGGYWRWGSSKDFSLVASGPVTGGITVVVTNYSLCPEVTIAEITRQSRAVIAWLCAHANICNGDPDRIFVAGHSAGGQQVGMLAATDWQGRYGLPQDVIKGIIPISGIFDLRPLRYSWLQPKLLLNHEIIMHQSPLFNIPASSPPLLVSLGGLESAEFHRQAAAYLEAWQAVGLSAELFVQEDRDHFGAIEGFTEAGSPLSQKIINFIEYTHNNR